MYYTVKQVASLTGKCEETIRRWLRNGTIKGIHTSRKEGYLIDEQELSKMEVKARIEYNTLITTSNDELNNLILIFKEQIDELKQTQQALIDATAKCEIIINMLENLK